MFNPISGRRGVMPVWINFCDLAEHRRTLKLADDIWFGLVCGACIGAFAFFVCVGYKIFGS